MNEEQQKKILAGDYASVGRDIKEKAKNADKLAKAIYETLTPLLLLTLKGLNAQPKWEECPPAIKYAYQMTACTLLLVKGVSIE